MKKYLILAATAATLALPSSFAFAQGSTAAGAVGGAAAGAVVGGPVGAVVGGAVGATIGAAAEPPKEVITYVDTKPVDTVTVEERIVVGEPMPEKVKVYAVPKHSEWSYAYVNGKRVIVETKSNKIVKIVD